MRYETIIRVCWTVGLTAGILALAAGLMFTPNATAAVHPILYLFWGDGCPHCEEEKEFLEIVKEEYPQVEMRLFEVWDHPEFAKLADAMRKTYEVKTSSVPMTFLGDWNHVGFRSFETTGVEMTSQIEQCLAQGCPDALDRLGPHSMVPKIRIEAANNAPDGWDLHRAASAEEEPAKDQDTSTAQPDEKITVYYFFGKSRCQSCITIEQYTEEAVLEAFTPEIKRGAIEFHGINVETPDTQHFVKDYQLYTKSVIVSDMVNGKERRWKNLEKVWELLGNEKAFKDYVKEEIKAYLEEHAS